jgi:hypothetical protein
VPRNAALPNPDSIGDDTLLRLGVAAALEFPDGSMSASGLRREALHGRLKVWRIAGKDYTTRQSLKDMRERCVLSNPHDSSYVAPARAAKPSGLSKTESGKSAQALAKASAERLKSRSRNISSNTDSRPSATVIPVKF